MSNNNGGWKPRKREAFTCADGSIVYVRRPGPELALRVSRIPRTFTKSLVENGAEESASDELERLSEEEQEITVRLAREVIVAMVDEPKLYLNPKEGQLGPDDTGADFWPLFTYAMTNYYNIKVPVGDGEVEVEDLETFREQPGVSGDGVDGVHVSRAAQHQDADSGLVDGAGA